ncbi:MAG: hypothetical protein ACR2LL_03185 [Nitrosopumilus sp.]|uniref:hypothetical protein n=1 Tax=Nitrosopumilus sp. TaxID=2024843 RepID=UPI00292F4984|nr:hypothetical protein [Nitrosopumilus sp.]
MVLICKGVCTRFKINRPIDTGRYCVGQKRCNHCNIFVMWEGIFCPCCGGRLRQRPRNRQYKDKYNETIQKREKREVLT